MIDLVLQTLCQQIVGRADSDRPALAVEPFYRNLYRTEQFAPITGNGEAAFLDPSLATVTYHLTVDKRERGDLRHANDDEPQRDADLWRRQTHAAGVLQRFEHIVDQRLERSID